MELWRYIGGSGKKENELYIFLVIGDILMVLAPEFHRFVWLCVEILFVCLLAWFRRFAMAENSIVEAEFKGMSCSTPINPFKPGNPFTPESDSSLAPSKNYFGSSSRRSHSANPFSPENESDNYSADLFTHHRKFMKPVKNPADYDGTQSLRDYLKHFERCSVVNGWSKEEAAVFLAASLRGEAQKVLNGLSDTDCRDYKKIVDKLELRFGVEKQRELHQARLHSRRQQENESVQALAADIRSMSSLAYQDLSPDTQERFAVQHFIDAIKDQDDRLRLRRDKPRTMDEALSLACELEAFRLLDGDWRGSSPKVRAVEEVDREPDLFKAQMEMLRSDLQAQQQRQETQQDALQQLVQQIQQLSQSMSLNTSGNQQRPPAPRYFSRHGPCWDCKEFGHYRRNCPTRKSPDDNKLGSGNASRVFPKGQGDA